MAERRVIVDTDSSSTHDYTSISSALTGELAISGNLVGDGDTLVIECRCSTGAQDTAAVTITDDWTLDATHTLTIEVPVEYRTSSASWDSTAYTLYVTSSRPIQLNTPYVILKGLQIDSGYSTGGYQDAINYDGSIQDGTIWIEDTFVCNSLWFYYQGNVNKARNDVVFKNCIGFDNLNGFISKDYSSGASHYTLYNCLAYNVNISNSSGYAGIINPRTNLTFDVYNCICMQTIGANTQDYLSSGFISGSNNIASDGTSLGDNSIINVDETDIFVSPGPRDGTRTHDRDFTLIADSTAIGTGTHITENLYDALGELREEYLPDIGPFAYNVLPVRIAPSWTEIFPAGGTPVTTYTWHGEISNNGRRIILASDGYNASPSYVYIGDNTGDTNDVTDWIWTESTPPDSTLYWSSCAISGDGNVFFAGQGYLGSGRLFRLNYNEVDATWTELQPDGDADRNWRIGVGLSYDGSVVLAGSYDRAVFLSIDGGDNWTTLTTLGTGGWCGVSVSDDGRHLLIGRRTGGPLWYGYHTSSDITSASDYTWTNLTTETNLPAGNIRGASISNNGKYMLVPIEYGRAWLSDDTGQTFTEINPIGGTAVNRAWSAASMTQDGKRMLIVNESGGAAARVWASNDYGNTWFDSTATGGNRSFCEISQNGGVIITGTWGGRWQIGITPHYNITDDTTAPQEPEEGNIKRVIVDTDPSSTHDYTSIASAISGELALGGDLVTDGTSLVIECRCSTGAQDTAAVTITDDWTLDATHTLTIEVPVEYRTSNGSWDSTAYTLYVTSSRPIQLYTPYVILKGLQIDSGYDTGEHQDAINYDGTITGGTIWVEDTIVCNSIWFYYQGNDNKAGNNVIFKNCIAFDMYANFTSQDPDGASSYYILYNCLAYNTRLTTPEFWNAGMVRSLDLLEYELYNCISFPRTGDSYTNAYSTFMSGSNNISSGETSLGDNSIINVVATSIFTSPGPLDTTRTHDRDFSLLSDGTAVGNGIHIIENLYDILGNTRDSSNPDIGPIAYNTINDTTEPVPDDGTSPLKVWSGTEWLSGTLKYFDGTAWSPGLIRRYDGTSWVPSL